MSRMPNQLCQLSWNANSLRRSTSLFVCVVDVLEVWCAMGTLHSGRRLLINETFKLFSDLCARGRMQ